jgi:predicted Rossmann fold nucleotide-binding protein DprA/Smf involved in DNA uptake
MGRPVFATANSIFEPNSQGIHALLEEKKVSLVYDFAKFLDRFFARKAEGLFAVVQSKQLSSRELKIIDILSEKSACGLQDLVVDMDMGIGELIPLLTMLEMENCIYQSMPGVYKRV